MSDMTSPATWTAAAQSCSQCCYQGLLSSSVQRCHVPTITKRHTNTDAACHVSYWNCLQALAERVEHALLKHSDALIHLRGPPAQAASPLRQGSTAPVRQGSNATLRQGSSATAIRAK